MALGALLGAYQEDDTGGLRGLLPLAGRTLIEYQVRCAAAAGAAPIVMVVERVPAALQDAIERLRLDGIPIFAASDVHEAVTRFEAGSLILLIGDGIAPPVDLVTALAEEPEPAVATFPDDEAHEDFERIDGEARWAGVALVEMKTLASTATMLGDWDLQSTLLRRTLQEGALRLPIAPETGEPILAESPEQLDNFQRGLVAASRGTRRDWASRYILPPVEEFATAELMKTGFRPGSLMWAAFALTLFGAAAFSRGWLIAGLVMLVLSTPLDTIAGRLATLRLRPLPTRLLSRRLLWPAAGIALLALGSWESRHGSGWGAMMAAVATAAFAQAARTEAGTDGAVWDVWLFSRRNAILAAAPFAVFGAWTSYLITMFVYAAASFFLLQNVRHSAPELTRS